MPHFPKPFFRPKKKRWYVELDGKQVNLGPDEQAAWAKYHEIMACRARGEDVCPAATAAPVVPLVVAILDAYLDWLQGRCAEGSRAPRTFDWYRDYLESFARSLPDSQSFTVDRLVPAHVYVWVDSQPDWRRGKRGAMTAVQRAFTWSAKAGLLQSLGGKSPLAGLEKPPQGRREELITPEQFREFFSLVKDREFSDLITTAWDTGARPHELMAVEARHVDLDNHRWVFPADESKGKKHARVLYLSDAALEITRRLMQAHPTGPLFRNTNGRAWTRYAINCRFEDLRIAAGKKRMAEQGLVVPMLKRLSGAERRDPAARERHHKALLERRKEVTRTARKLGGRCSLYLIRHAWCTRALASGQLDAVTVAQLMGHRDTQMISRVYQHLMQHPDHLKNAAKKVADA